MKTLICQKPGSLRLEDRPFPVPGPGEVLLRVRRVGVCGTDLHAFEGTQPYFSYPRILGHELGCEVADANGHEGLRDGDAVTVIPYIHCGHCGACLKGRPNCCVSLSVLGVHADGGMQEYMAVPASAVVYGDGLGLDVLALVEPLAIGAHGVRRAAIGPGEDVLVIGAGPIGMGLMCFARMQGARVIAMDVNSGRLEACRALGVECRIHSGTEASEEAVREITGGRMPDVVIDATGNLSAINHAFGLLSHAGRYVLVGLQKGDIQFSHPAFHKREATLMSSRNATAADFHTVMGRFHDGSLSADDFLTHRASLQETAALFPTWQDPATGVVKALIHI